MLPVLNVGPFAIQLPGLILLAGIWFGLNRSESFARRRGLDVEQINALILYSLLGGLVGARLGYIAQNLAAFSQKPLDALALSPQMLDGASGLVAMLLIGLIYGQRKHLHLWQTLDALTPALGVLMMSVALMNLASGSGFGIPARLPWSIYLFDEYRHPTQLYDFGMAVVIWRIVESRPGDFSLPDGKRFLMFVSLSAFARIAVDMFRSDRALIGLGGVGIEQLTAWFILVAAVWLMQRKKTIQTGGKI